MKENRFLNRRYGGASVCAGFAFLACIAFLASDASRAYAADPPSTMTPSLFNVKEVIVRLPDFPNQDAANACRLSQKELADAINKSLRDNGVPSIPAGEALPPLAGRARIDFVPQVVTYSHQGLDCTSWLSLTAEARGSTRLFAGDMTRRVTLLFWTSGQLLTTAQTTHERLVSEALQKLSADFAKQYKMQQPTTLMNQDELNLDAIGNPVPQDR